MIKRSSMKSRVARRFLLASIVAASAITARADTITWNGAATGTWNSTATNWNTALTDPWDATNGLNNSAVFNTASLNAPVSGTVYTNGITFSTAGTLSGSGIITFAGTNPTLTNAVAATITAPIAGTVTKTGVGQLSLGTLNAGATLIVNQGTLSMSAGGGIKGTIQVNNGATLTNSTVHVFSRTTDRVFINGGSLTQSGSEFYLPAGASAADPGLQMTGGSVSGGDMRFDSGATAYIRINPASTTATISATLRHYQTGTEVFNVVGGSVPSGIDLLVSGSLQSGFNQTNKNNVTKTGAGLMEVTGTLGLVNDGDFTFSEGTVRLTGTAPITNFGSTNSTMILDAANNVTLQFNAANAADSVTFTKNIIGGSTNAVVQKIGAGTLTLSGTKSYTGTTQVQAGTLNLTGTLSNSSVTVASGATLTGEGSLGATGNLTFNNTSNLRIDGSTPTAALTVGGNLSLSGTTTVFVDGVPAPTNSTQNFRVLNYNGTLTGGAGNFALSNPLSEYRNAAFDTSTANQVNLSLATYNIAWSGATNGVWDHASTANWSVSPDGKYYRGDAVTFGNGPANRDITLNTTVTLPSISFNNSVGNDYSISGTGSIAGTSGLAVTGTGKVTLANANSYTGATTIAAGSTLQLGNATANGSIASTSSITNNGSLIFANSAAAQTSAVAISGSGSLVKTGTNTLTISNANSYNGGTTISQGTLQAGNVTATPGTVTLGDANTGTNNVAWLFAGSLLPATNLVVSNLGTGTATIGTYSGGVATTSSGTITLNRATIFADATGDRTTFTGKISGNPGTITITGGRITFDNAANDFAGNLLINTGSVFQSNNISALPATTSITINGNGNYRFNATGTHNIDALNSTSSTSGVNIVAAGNTTLSLGSSNGSGSFVGVISNGSNTLSLTKAGSGTQALSGLNTYTGSTTVSGGTLLANTPASGINSATGTGAVSVSANAKLGGTGQIRPGGANGISVAANGILAPGASIGTLTIDSSGSSIASIVTMATGAKFEYELGTAGGSIGTFGTSDRLVIASSAVGDVTFNNNTIDFLSTGSVGFYKLFDTNLADATNAGDSWAGLTYDESTGVVSSGLTAANLNGTGTFIVGTASNGGDVGDIYLNVAAIPEPSTLVAGSLMALGLGLVARRRRR